MVEKQTQRVWEADLSEPGKKLTLEELRALEAMHQCQQIQRMSESLVFALMHLRSIEGRIDRLEQYLQRIDARYPRNADTDTMLILPTRTQG